MDTQLDPLGIPRHPLTYDSLENANLKRQLAQLIEDCDDLKEDKRAYRASKDRAEADLDAARTDLNSAKDDILRLRMELEQVKSENAHLRRKMEEESQEDRKWFMMVEKLRAKISELEKSSASTRSGSSSRELALEPLQSSSPAGGLDSTPGQAGPSGATPSSVIAIHQAPVENGVRRGNKDTGMNAPALSGASSHSPTNTEANQASPSNKRPIVITPTKPTQVPGAPPTPDTPLRIRIPSGAALGKLKRNNGLNGDYWTCFKTPEKDNRLRTRSRHDSSESSPRSRTSSRPLKRPRLEPRPITAGSGVVRSKDDWLSPGRRALVMGKGARVRLRLPPR